MDNEISFIKLINALSRCKDTVQLYIKKSEHLGNINGRDSNYFLSIQQKLDDIIKELNG